MTVSGVSIDAPMPIVTPRLVLRPIQPTDAPAIFEAQHESWPELSRWSIWAWGSLGDLTIGAIEAFAVDKKAKFARGEDIMLLSFQRENGKLLGACGLHKPDWDRRIFTIGFWVRTGETKKGYAGEVANALARYAFGALAATKLLSNHEDGNERSGVVLRKTGFRYSHVRPGFHAHGDGPATDDHVYELNSLDDVPALDVSWG